MKDLRIVTPCLVVIVIALLGFLVTELRGAKEYSDKMLDRHESHPHFLTEKRIDTLEQGIVKLTLEIKVLTKEISLLRKTGGINYGNR